MTNVVQWMQRLTPALAIATQFQRAMAYAITKTDVNGQIIRRIMTLIIYDVSIVNFHAIYKGLAWKH